MILWLITVPVWRPRVAARGAGAKRGARQMCYLEPCKLPRYAEPQVIALRLSEPAPLVQQINYEYALVQRDIPTPK